MMGAMDDASLAGVLQPVATELALWQEAGLSCRLWWRDDDLVAVTPNLRRMLAVSERWQVPLLVAVIPKPMTPTLARETLAMPSLVWCQHGYAHVNHEAPGQPKSEFPAHRAYELALADLSHGRSLLLDAFGSRLLPVLVPPWNNFRADLLATLPSLGLKIISQYGQTWHSVENGILRVDAHIDVAARGGADPFTASQATAIVERLLAALQQRRLNPGRSVHSLGLLTHHRVMGEGVWAFFDAVLKLCLQFRCVRWLSPVEVFQLPSTAAPHTHPG